MKKGSLFDCLFLLLFGINNFINLQFVAFNLSNCCFKLLCFPVRVCESNERWVPDIVTSIDLCIPFLGYSDVEVLFTEG